MDSSSKSPMRDRSVSSQYNISDITTFLQREFTRFEQERSSFQLEREEYQRKIVQLEQFKKSQEKIQFDLLRRIKMLEFALRNERFKLQQVMDTIKSSDPELHQTLEANVVSLPSVKGAEDLNSDFAQEQSQLPPSLAQNLLAQAPKSGDILKRCLEDLNSSDVLALLAKSSDAPADAFKSSVDSKTYDDDSVKSEDTLEKPQIQHDAPIASLPQQRLAEDLISSTPVIEPISQEVKPSVIELPVVKPESTPSAVEPNNQSVESAADDKFKQVMKHINPQRSSNSYSSKKIVIAEPNPRKNLSEDNRTWADMKNSVFEKLQDVKLDKEPPRDTPRIPVSNSNEDSAAVSAAKQQLAHEPIKVYKSKCALYHHLDGVRCVAFHETEPIVVSCSEDATIKMWSMSDINAHSTITQPVHTFRGHIGAVYSVATFKQLLYSAGEDGTIKIWDLPPHDQDPFTNHGIAVPYLQKTLTGHSDIVWSLCAHKFEPLVLSASSDGTCRLWSSDKDSEIQKLLLNNGANPTSASFLWSDPRKCVVSYANSYSALFDLETGKAIWSSPATSNSANSSNSHLIYQIVAHPTLPMLITANEDKYIRFLDSQTGKCTFEMVGHKDAVTSLSIESSGLYFVSGGHDANLRMWDLTSKQCVQDISVTHRKKYDEAVHSVAFHPSKALAASAGADSVVKIYS